MKKSGKRFVSALLVFLMCLSMFAVSFSASAACGFDAENVEEGILKAATELSLVGKSKYVIDGAYLRNVKDKTTAKTLKSNFSNSNVSVYMEDGTAAADDSIIGTGCKVSISGNDDSALTIVVIGDLTGDGVVDATDYLRIKMKFLGTIVLSDSAYQAGDADGSGVINSTDYQRIKSHFLGLLDLFYEEEIIEPESSEEISVEVSSEAPSEAPSEESTESEESGIESENKTNYALNKTYSISGSLSYLTDDKKDNGSLLTDGVVPTAEEAGKTAVFVGTNASNSIVINLGAKYIDINEIVVSGVVVNGNRQYATVTIEASTNGISYTTIADYTLKSTEYASYAYEYSYKLNSNVTAKYIKVTLVSQNYVLTVGEIEVYGGNAPAEPEPEPSPDFPTDDKLFIAKSGDMYTDAENATVLIFPGSSVQSLYAYKLYAIYDANVNGYVVQIMAAAHRSYFQTVPSNGIGIVFNFNPGEILGRNFARQQYEVWTKIRPGDIIRPSGIDVANRTMDLTGSIANNNLITNAYFTVEYAPRYTPETLYNGKTVVALGDSITENGGWVEGVSDRIGTTIINSGISGNTTTDCLARFDADVAAHNPDLVLIMLGLNDVLPWSYSNENLNTYRRELGQLYDKCAALGAKVVFMTPNDFNIASLDYSSRYGAYGGLANVFAQFRSAMASVAAEKGCQLIDIYTPFHNTGDVKGHLIDTVHPNDYGYEIFINTISDGLLKNQNFIMG